jgi:hypothetical protein
MHDLFGRVVCHAAQVREFSIQRRDHRFRGRETQAGNFRNLHRVASPAGICQIKE